MPDAHRAKTRACRQFGGDRLGGEGIPPLTPERPPRFGRRAERCRRVAVQQRGHRELQEGFRPSDGHATDPKQVDRSAGGGPGLSCQLSGGEHPAPVAQRLPEGIPEPAKPFLCLVE